MPLFYHYQAPVFQRRTAVILCVELLLTVLTKSLAKNDRVLMLLELMSAAPWTTCLRLKVFHSVS